MAVVWDARGERVWGGGGVTGGPKGGLGVSLVCLICSLCWRCPAGVLHVCLLAWAPEAAQST